MNAPLFNSPQSGSNNNNNSSSPIQSLFMSLFKAAAAAAAAAPNQAPMVSPPLHPPAYLQCIPGSGCIGSLQQQPQQHQPNPQQQQQMNLGNLLQNYPFAAHSYFSSVGQAQSRSFHLPAHHTTNNGYFTVTVDFRES